MEKFGIIYHMHYVMTTKTLHVETWLGANGHSLRLTRSLTLEHDEIS